MSIPIPEETFNFPKNLVLTVHSQPWWTSGENEAIKHLTVGSIHHAKLNSDNEYVITYSEGGRYHQHTLPMSFLICYFNIKKPGRIV